MEPPIIFINAVNTKIKEEQSAKQERSDAEHPIPSNLLMDDPELGDIYSKKLKEHKLQLNALDERIQLLESQLKNISKEPNERNKLCCTA